jgi:uncharacterized protein (DUF924 family)
VAITSPEEAALEAGQQSVLDYWFNFDHSDAAAMRRRMRLWFVSDPATDRDIEARFGALVTAAAKRELLPWARTSTGRLALIILLDQFPRNLYRGTAAAFAHDSDALRVTREGIAAGADRDLPTLARMFFYMPLQHSESPAVQAESLRVFRALSAEPAAEPVAATLAEVARFATLHADIITQFGRFPHRNRVLGRTSTAAELIYLDQGPTFGQ